MTITTVRHHSIVMAGAVVTASTLAWTVGSWIQARLNQQWEGTRLVRSGPAPHPGRDGRHGVAAPSRRTRLGGVRRLVRRRAGHGPQLRAHLAHDAPGGSAGREGWASASLNLADVLGIALGVGIGGAAVAAVSRGSRAIAGGVVIAFAMAALAAIVALLVAGRLPGSLERSPAEPATR